MDHFHWFTGFDVPLRIGQNKSDFFLTFNHQVKISILRHCSLFYLTAINKRLMYLLDQSKEEPDGFRTCFMMMVSGSEKKFACFNAEF